MKPLLHILRLIWAGQRWSLARGTALAVVVLAAGVALLGLSGWFITAAGAAGLAGIGIAFNLFQPSASVRGLALGRTAARYGERVLTHDATLRSLAAIRVRLLTGVLALPYPRLSRLRGAETLNRLVADVNALDGVALRLFIPALSALLVLGGSLLILAWLTDPKLALWITGSFTLGSSVALIGVARAARAPSRRAETALQAFRIRLIDLLRARDDLVVYGRLADQTDAVRAAEDRMRDNLRRTDRIERRAGVILSLTASVAAGGALWLGAALVQSGAIAPAMAALGFFAALALAETTGPLRRGLADLGRMQVAARNVVRLLPATAVPSPPLPHPAALIGTAPALALDRVTYRHPGAAQPVLERFSLSVAAGETVALTGPSGGGKSTILALTAGLIAPDAGEISLFGQPIATLPEPALRREVAFLPQRSAILGTSFMDVLALADPDLTETDAQSVLQAVALWGTVQQRGGLHAPLRENGTGLSGGEQRRLTLARTLLRRPRLLLLDEPTEGLDHATAATVLRGIRRMLPETAILTASHRRVEQDWADRLAPLGGNHA
ncbi:amino acid ABC transporter ATP-binding/permease protein [Actibacterium sp. D379-3]